MKKFKLLFLGLLILISVSFIYQSPGISSFDIFYSFVYNHLPSLNLNNLFTDLLRFPLGVQAFFIGILNYFPLDKPDFLFYGQTAWLIHKFIIYGFYILTWISILLFAKFTKAKNTKISLINVSLYYFLSFSILLLSVALSSIEILTAPFFILSILFLFKKKFKLAFIFYLLSLLFNWTILIFAPLYFWYCFVSTKGKSSFSGFLFFLLVMLFLFFLPIYFGFALKVGPSGVMFDLLPRSISFGLIKFAMLFSKSNLIFLLFEIVFMVSYFIGLKKIIKLNLETDLKFLIGLFCLYLLFVVFFPTYPEGSLLWLTILSLLIWINSPSRFTSFKLLLVNILVFVNIYLFFGPSGVVPIRGKFFEIFRYLLSSLSIIFAFWYLRLFLKQKHFTAKVFSNLDINAVNWLKKFIIIFLSLMVIAHIPAMGSPEGDDYAGYVSEFFKYGSPFKSQLQKLINFHPPLNILILAFFNSLWNRLNGINNDYYTGTKLAIFFFYLMTVISYLIFGKPEKHKDKLLIIEKLLIILTTFILVIGSLGQTDLNIFLFPFIIGSVYTLFKKKYFWSGLLIGISFVIKWQSIILFPLFAVSLVHFNKKISEIFKDSLYFLFGFVPAVVIPWIMFISQPGGFEGFKIIFNAFYHNRGNYLSGDSLNLGWVVGYFSLPKIISINKSLAAAGMTNFSIGANNVPYIFRGILFSIATIVIVFRFWLFQKKNIITFLSAAVMIYFSYQMLGRGTQELHFIYVVALMLFLYLIRPTPGNRMLLILLDIMSIMNLIFFFCLTGYPCLTRKFIGGFDITVIFAIYYTVIFLWVFWRYLKGGLLFEKEKEKFKN